MEVKVFVNYCPCVEDILFKQDRKRNRDSRKITEEERGETYNNLEKSSPTFADVFVSHLVQLSASHSIQLVIETISEQGYSVWCFLSCVRLSGRLSFSPIHFCFYIDVSGRQSVIMVRRV